MTYNIKSLARGALLGAAGLAMLASAGCSTRIDTVGWEDGNRARMPFSTFAGTLTKNPKLAENHMELNLKQNGTNAVLYIDFESGRASEICVKKTMYPDLRKGSQMKLDYIGDVKDGRLDASSLRGFSSGNRY